MYAAIHTISPFDSAVGTNITFTWSGNQIYKVRCIIKNNISGTTVYDQTVSTMKQNFTIPTTSGLVNGTKYLAFITVFDVDDTESTIQSIGTPFYCFATPTFTLSISENDVIRASSYETSITYTQTESELLNWFSITLYTYQKTQLQTSGTVYDVSDLSYIITNLSNATQYYIRGIGETVNGISLDTGYILFTVSYEVAQIFSTLELNNIAESGAIEIKCNIISELGVSESDVTYIDGEYADLTNNSVTFNEGFEVTEDFTIEKKLYSPIRNAVILSFTGEGGLVGYVYYRIGSYSDSDGEKCFFELKVNSAGVYAVYYTNYLLIPDSTKEFCLLITRKNGYYDMKAVLVNKT